MVVLTVLTKGRVGRRGGAVGDIRSASRAGHVHPLQSRRRLVPTDTQPGLTLLLLSDDVAEHRIALGDQ